MAVAGCLAIETSLERLSLSETADEGSDGDKEGIYCPSEIHLSADVLVAAALSIFCWAAAAAGLAEPSCCCHLRYSTCSSPYQSPVF